MMLEADVLRWLWRDRSDVGDNRSIDARLAVSVSSEERYGSFKRRTFIDYLYGGVNSQDSA